MSASSSAAPLITDSRSPPSSVQTSSSYRSPTKWTNFEDEEYNSSEDAEGSASEDAQGRTSPNPRRFARLNSHSSSGPFHAGNEAGSMTALSDGTETRNLLDADAFSEADAQSLSEEDPYVMTDEQKMYYTENFKLLHKATQDGLDLSGAIRGADPTVVGFFRKSNLDTTVLSRVWELADVNRDGWLNLEEFCCAMHLVVLAVKGNMPVPEYLPPHIAPVHTPPRFPDTDRDTPGSMSQAGPSVGGWHNFEERTAESDRPMPDSAPSPMDRQFTNLPPPSSAVGGPERPVAVKVTAEKTDQQPGTPKYTSSGGAIPHVYQPVPTPPRRASNRAAGAVSDDDRGVYPRGPAQNPAAAVSLKKASTLPTSPPGVAPPGPKGPPPKPPPRPPHRHGRSASLDLTRGGLEEPKNVPKINPSDQNLQPVPSTSSAGGPPTSPGSHRGSSTHSTATPSDPQLPPLPMLPAVEAGTQTETSICPGQDWPDVGFTRKRFSGAPPMLDLEEDDDGVINEGKGPPKEAGGAGAEGGPPLDWKGRCRKLEKANEELEKERERLAEQRLYLELQLQRARDAAGAKK